MDRRFQSLGFGPGDILLPRAGTDMKRWAVVACDQFTSQPDYWRAVEREVGDAPSTLRLILPEARLNDPDVDRQIREINASMERYCREGLFRQLPNAMIYIERTQSDGAVRRGLLGIADLECYDFTPGSGALIRATEGTVLSRIPPRVRVRRDAPVELPHVMLLLDDPEGTVIEPLAGRRGQPLYDFDLQQRGGHLTGWQLTEGEISALARALADLGTPEAMERRYGLGKTAPMLFVVGDGNHSLAAAKQCWEQRKQTLPEDRWADCPARYALVEVVNSHDPALRFEPIHRCVFETEPEALLKALLERYPGAYEGEGEGHTFAYTFAGHTGWITVPHPVSQLAAGTLQAFLDEYLQDHSGRVDYIHGEEAAARLGAQPGNIAFRLPAMGKDQLFKTVLADGVLPRKTFSMGNAEDKRYYVEARRIR